MLGWLVKQHFESKLHASVIMPVDMVTSIKYPKFFRRGISKSGAVAVVVIAELCVTDIDISRSFWNDGLQVQGVISLTSPPPLSMTPRECRMMMTMIL